MKRKKIFLKQSRRRSLLNSTLYKSIIKIPLFLLEAVFLLSFFIITDNAFSQNISDNKESAKVYGDAFVTAGISDARTMVPILASDSASGGIVGLVFNGLVKYNEDLELIGDLALRWEVSEDGLVITFFLKRNVKWHDGHPFTAGDVQFTFEKLRDPDVPTPYGGDFEKVKSFEIIDDYTVRIIYKEPFSPGLASWAMPIMPEHVLKDENLLLTKFSRNPVGTGPYIFKRWQTGQRIDLISNHEYFEHRPFINRYIYRIIPDTATMFLELETKNLDEMSLTPLQYKRLTDTSHFTKGFRKFRYPSFGYTYMGYNLTSELFKDRKVRLAINHAVDKEEIIDGVLLGLGRVCTGPFPPDSWAYNKNVKSAEFNAQLARRILNEAGWVDSDSDGWLDKDGQKFEFTLLTNQGNERRVRSAEIIQRRLEDVGIKVNIRVLEWAVFLNEFVNKKKFDAVLLGWGLGRDPDCYDIWHSSKTRPGEFNFVGYSNKKVDTLLDEGRRVFDKGKRQEIYHEIHEMIYDDQPYLFLYIADALIAVHRRFQGIKPTQIGIGYNFIDWHVPKDRQRYKQ